MGVVDVSTRERWRGSVAVAGATLAEMPNAKCDGEGRRKCPLRVLMDAGVVIHSEFAEHAVKEMSESPVRWSDGSAIRISGLKRKQPDEDEDYRKQKEALFTIGRMIREQNIEAVSYTHLDVYKRQPWGLTAKRASGGGPGIDMGTSTVVPRA